MSVHDQSNDRAPGAQWRRARAALTVIALAALWPCAPAQAQETVVPSVETPREPPSLVRWRALMAGEVTRLDALLAEYAAAHPALDMAEAEAEMIRARAEVVDTLPDPILRVMLANVPWTSWKLDAMEMSGVEVALEWMFPWPGTLGAQRRAELAEAEAVATTSGEMAIELELEASAMYWMVYRIDRVLEALDDIEQLLADMQRLVEARYRYNQASEGEVLQVGLERSMLDQERLAMLAERAELAARFNAMIGRDLTAPLVPPKDLDLEPLPADVYSTLLARALEARPAFATYAARLDALGVRVEAAEAMAWPELMVGGSWMFHAAAQGDHLAGEDLVSLMVGVTLPFGSAARASDEVAMIERERQVVEVERAITVREIEVALAGQIARLEELAGQVKYVRESLLADARATLDTMIAMYPTGGAEFLELLEAQRRIFETEIELRMLVSEHKQLRDALERQTGAPVSLAGGP